MSASYLMQAFADPEAELKVGDLLFTDYGHALVALQRHIKAGAAYGLIRDEVHGNRCATYDAQSGLREFPQ
ncbi:hypothetical protein KFK14_11530 [Sphingobium phenoxybenzoativorans]|uniref:Uncharacterized protein n=1 Tax=Sphingobium phenoxybenzoativorans TaxID=1592790 RepID=A0A975KAS9_9SPHN|nr:hypothetical protein [Sphingobium phenoxybenzoativorans]QUT07958.1 hypothetical protein KFK14_11530 [Sphingobium phenoxybenzoativorans]